MPPRRLSTVLRPLFRAPPSPSCPVSLPKRLRRCRCTHMIGVRYQWGGNSPDSGLDCSGFVRYVFRDTLGMTLPRRAEEMSQVGEKVKMDGTSSPATWCSSIRCAGRSRMSGSISATTSSCIRRRPAARFASTSSTTAIGKSASRRAPGRGFVCRLAGSQGQREQPRGPAQARNKEGTVRACARCMPPRPAQRKPPLVDDDRGGFSYQPRGLHRRGIRRGEGGTLDARYCSPLSEKPLRVDDDRRGFFAFAAPGDVSCIPVQ